MLYYLLLSSSFLLPMNDTLMLFGFLMLRGGIEPLRKKYIFIFSNKVLMCEKTDLCNMLLGKYGKMAIKPVIKASDSFNYFAFYLFPFIINIHFYLLAILVRTIFHDWKWLKINLFMSRLLTLQGVTPASRLSSSRLWTRRGVWKPMWHPVESGAPLSLALVLSPA